MPWIKMPGVKGRVYQPASAPTAKRKHRCVDCHACQMCGESRCRDCRKRTTGNGRGKGRAG